MSARRGKSSGVKNFSEAMNVTVARPEAHWRRVQQKHPRQIGICTRTKLKVPKPVAECIANGCFNKALSEFLKTFKLVDPPSRDLSSGKLIGRSASSQQAHCTDYLLKRSEPKDFARDTLLDERRRRSSTRTFFPVFWWDLVALNYTPAHLRLMITPD
uniref:Uncharacterized protein n=1 Tax=Spongospora subterranea TaxID=70186 RepID=A0A0H5RE49_9EUKA|eukprot:CRZ12530.1 hypothetical protein [Spongospora subterranea]